MLYCAVLCGIVVLHDVVFMVLSSIDTVVILNDWHGTAVGTAEVWKSLEPVRQVCIRLLKTLELLTKAQKSHFLMENENDNSKSARKSERDRRECERDARRRRLQSW